MTTKSDTPDPFERGEMFQLPDPDDPRFAIKWYDRAGHEITILEWGSLFHIEDYQRVGRDVVGDIVISTVWLGLDHGFSWLHGHGGPLIFETMVFGAADEDGDEIMRRYETESQAIEGHAETVACFKARVS